MIMVIIMTIMEHSRQQSERRYILQCLYLEVLNYLIWKNYQIVQILSRRSS